MNVVFVTDGGVALGMGHVQQSTTLARHLRHAANVSFLTKSNEKVVERIRQAGFLVTRLSDDIEILGRLHAASPDVIIFDKLDVEESLAREIRATLRSRLVIFTNLTRANDHAHVAVTADLGSRFENVTYVDPKTGTLTYLGPKYWILRPEFYELAATGKASSDELRRVMLIFGGSDPLNITSAALDALLTVGTSTRIDVVLGAQFSWDADILRVLGVHPSSGERVTVLRNIDDVAQRMYAADLVVASPGLSAFEALAVGTPVIVLPQDDLQRDTYKGFFCMLERHEAAELPNMIARRDFSRPADPQIARMEIGQGISELVSLILRLGEMTT